MPWLLGARQWLYEWLWRLEALSWLLGARQWPYEWLWRLGVTLYKCLSRWVEGW